MILLDVAGDGGRGVVSGARAADRVLAGPFGPGLRTDKVEPAEARPGAGSRRCNSAGRPWERSPP